jgi:hypothetical protein
MPERPNTTDVFAAARDGGRGGGGAGYVIMPSLGALSTLVFEQGDHGEAEAR